MRLTLGPLFVDHFVLMIFAGRPPTQKEMARELGVSQALVSRALSGRALQIGASPRTVLRIQRMAQRRGYRPHPAALALRGAPSRVLGVVVKDFEDPYFGRLTSCLQAEAREYGISLIFTGHGVEDVAGLQRQRVEGLILAGSDFRPEGLRRAVGYGTPVVQLGTGAVHPGACLIGMDEAAGVAMLVAHLCRLGHRSIAFAGASTAAHRRRAIHARAALRRHKATWTSFVDPDPASIVRNITKLLVARVSGRPTAVIAGDDMLALALTAGFAGQGLKVPNHLSIVGIDDIPASSLALPRLTTLAQPMPQMAAEALSLLSQQGSGRLRAPRLFPGRLIVRESCAPAPTCLPI